MLGLKRDKKKTSPVNPELQFRKTLKNSGSIEGVGLHSGEKMKITFHPAEEGTGLVFICRRPDFKNVTIPVHLKHVVDTSLAVTLGVGSVYVQTVEHLMYALFVHGITDLVMETEGGSEIPILDGSAQPFIDLFEELETHEHQSEVKPIIISRPVTVTDGNRYIVGLPADHFKVSYNIDYPHPNLRNQFVELDFDPRFFKSKIGSARTFGFLKDVQMLREKGLALGGSTVNALIYTPDSTLNEPRFVGESLYHKILDLVGDLALIGRPLQGHILGSRGGHALDVAFGKKILTTFTNETEVNFFERRAS
ncbi:MAG: UDP-3-O-[3-hydroxymyristoyl] N-acetylglucosamine deacetylase [Leptospiraceae bacterium]|nr:UDP-3-O-[3-hydroxymyristoyl] N-acetylglucosamine deacetylase [Leptospiraceae bacterium]